MEYRAKMQHQVVADPGSYFGGAAMQAAPVAAVPAGNHVSAGRTEAQRAENHATFLAITAPPAAPATAAIPARRADPALRDCPEDRQRTTGGDSAAEGADHASTAAAAEAAGASSPSGRVSAAEESSSGGRGRPMTADGVSPDSSTRERTATRRVRTSKKYANVSVSATPRFSRTLDILSPQQATDFRLGRTFWETLVSTGHFLMQMIPRPTCNHFKRTRRWCDGILIDFFLHFQTRPASVLGSRYLTVTPSEPFVDRSAPSTR